MGVLMRIVRAIGLSAVAALVVFAFVYMALGVAGNYRDNHTRTAISVSAQEAAVNEYVIDLKRQNGVKVRLGKARYDNYLSLTLGANDTYQAAFYKNREKVGSFVIDSGPWAEITDSAGKKPILHLIPAHIVKKGYDTIILSVLRGDGDYTVANVTTPDYVGPLANANLIDFEIKQLEIDIGEKNIEKIRGTRDEALSLGVLLAGDDDHVSAKIIADGAKYDVEIRLKGTLSDHWGGDKWSFRIELDGDNAVWGMQKFSVQDPATRNFLDEGIAYAWYSFLGGVAIRYDYCDLFVNGEYKGVYALEEFFEKRVVEHSEKREGPILKLNDNLLVFERNAYYIPSMVDIYSRPGNSGESRDANSIVEVFAAKKTLLNQELRDYARYAIDAYNRAWSGKGSILDIFDATLIAREYALLDIFQVTHGTLLYNERFYYNPITALLEPIPFDLEAKSYITYNSIYPYGEFTKAFFSDDKFRQLYKTQVDYVLNSAKTFLEDYAVENKTDLVILRRDLYEYEWNGDFIEENMQILGEIVGDEYRIPPSVSADGALSGVAAVQIRNEDIGNVIILGVESEGLPLDCDVDFPMTMDTWRNKSLNVAVTIENQEALDVLYKYWYDDLDQTVRRVSAQLP
jgi:hypothetical protein